MSVGPYGRALQVAAGFGRSGYDVSASLCPFPAEVSRHGLMTVLVLEVLHHFVDPLGGFPAFEKVDGRGGYRGPGSGFRV